MHQSGVILFVNKSWSVMINSRNTLIISALNAC